jgi:hypothetical protein
MPRLLGRVRAVPVAALLAALAVPSALPAQTLTRAITLLWTATGDNGTVGQAAKYDLRYTANQVVGTDTLTWWNTSAVVNMTSYVPSPAGQRDSAVVAGLVVGKKYYAILRVADSAGNWSGFSNIALIDLTKGVAGIDTEATAAPKLVVGAPYPSPTSGRAQVALRLARSGPLAADVFDARGRLVRRLENGIVDAGDHVIRWDGASEGGAPAGAGVYWIRVASAGVQKSVKLIVVR